MASKMNCVPLFKATSTSVNLPKNGNPHMLCGIKCNHARMQSLDNCNAFQSDDSRQCMFGYINITSLLDPGPIQIHTDVRITVKHILKSELKPVH